MPPACPELRVLAWPGTEPWVPSRDVQQRLACLLSKPVIVEYVPRAGVDHVWRRDHGGKPLPVGRYAFRAWSRGNKAILFVDGTETAHSATWLLLHELAHIELPQSRLLAQAYRSMPRPKDYLKSDHAHEAHPEEQLANQVATATMPALGLPKRQFDRLWWRERVRGLT